MSPPQRRPGIELNAPYLADDDRHQRETCGYSAWEVVVFDSDRVCLIYWLGEPARMEEERSAFDRLISTFRFAPE